MDAFLKQNPGATPLMYYSSIGDLQEATKLATTEPVNAVDDSLRNTALMYAASGNHLDIVRMLVENGAELFRRNFNGKTAADAAYDGGYTDVELYLINKMGFTDLINAIRHKESEDRIRQIMNKHPDQIRQCDKNGLTPLMYCCIYYNIPPVQEFIDPKDIDHRTDKLQTTALMYAAWMGRTDTVRLLLDKGADIHAIDNNRNTALMLAAWKGHTDTVRLLLDKGADIHAKANDDYTALMYAAWKGRTDIVGLLLDKGADINAKNTNGGTALMLAAAYGHTATVNLLLHKGADIFHRNNSGQNAADYAFENGETGLGWMLSTLMLTPMLLLL